MKARLLSFLTNPLVRGGSFFYIGSMAVNFGGFAYHLIMARLLGPIDYGILGSLIGLTYFIGIPVGAVDLLITKVISGFDIKDASMKSGLLARKFLQKMLIVSMVFLPIWVLASSRISNFLHIEGNHGVIYLGLIVMLMTLGTGLGSILKGLLRLEAVITSQIIGITSRIALSVLFIYMISATYISPMLGTTLSMLIYLLVVLWILLPIIRTSADYPSLGNLNWKKIGLSSLFLSGSFTALYSIDLVLVKHFLDPHSAGLYAVLATAGKIVIFATAPITAVLLPVASRKSLSPDTARQNLLQGIILTSMVGVTIATCYFLFSGLIIETMFTNKFSEAGIHLGTMGLIMYLYALAFMCGNFLIGIGKLRSSVISAMALVAEVVLIWIFHRDISQILQVLLWVFGILALMLLFFSINATKPTSKK